MLQRIIFGFLFLVTASAANAHKPSDSYLTITGGEPQLRAQWDIALKDLEMLVGLDANHNGEITWGELKSRRSDVTQHALAYLKISADGQSCPASLNELLVDQHSDGAYAVLDLALDCPGDAGKLVIKYSLLFDRDPTHRGLVLYRDAGKSSTHIIKPDDRELTIYTNEGSLWATLKDFVIDGVWHIWNGFDHLLFLLTLMLPAVLLRRNGRWQPVPRFRPALIDIFKIVTAFTIAHSITLWLAVLGFIALPTRLVESLIAVSILVTALNNLRPVLPLSLWMVAFAFGLIHGFGFASVLMDLGLTGSALAVSLFGFNVGVELGQMAVVALLFPMAYMLRDTPFYRWVILRGGSLVAAVLAALWLYERAFNHVIIGF